MAVRDVRRYRGRSILVFVMVAVPVGILASLTTVAASGAVDNLDRAPLSLGPAQALLTGPNPEPVIQRPDPDLYQAGAGGANAATATPIPGFDVAQSLGSDANVAALARLTGGTIERVGSIEMRHRVATTTGTGTRSRSAQVMVFDAASRDWGTKATLTSGRWASGPTEVVVTPYGISRGIPSSGTTTLVSQGKDYPVTVVGVANVFNGWGGQPDAVTPEPVASDELHSWQWLLLRDQGMPYSEVRELNGYGLAVVSVEALRHPPSEAELPAEVRQVSDFQSGELRLIVGLGGVMLFIVVTLLVAPAFAVSAARQRRTLALAASNGAETRQLRRTVLAQALVLGAASAVAATALGALLVGAGIAAWARYRPWSTFRYFDVSVPALVAIAGFAVVSAIIAALVPAARLGRLDIVGVMRGQSVSPALNRTLPVAGIILAVAGGTGLLWSVRTGQHELPVALSGIALTLGALLLVPLLLVLAGRLARRLPVTPRMATRDAARHRGRSGPTVAAIMAGTVALTIFSVALASDTEQRRREYQPQLAVGDGYVYVSSTQVNPVTGQPDEPDYTVVTSALGQVTPHLSTTPL
jgi:putative ABC transport system permease protein